MRAAQFVLLSVAVAVALAQPPALGATPDAASATACWRVDAVHC